jgi:hypothetical protein
MLRSMLLSHIPQMIYNSVSYHYRWALAIVQQRLHYHDLTGKEMRVFRNTDLCTVDIKVKGNKLMNFTVRLFLE